VTPVKNSDKTCQVQAYSKSALRNKSLTLLRAKKFSVDHATETYFTTEYIVQNEKKN